MKITITLVLLSISLTSIAQVPDWTETTCDGTEYNMQNELNKGNAVLIDFSAMWCTPCNTIAPATEDIWQNFDSGNDNLMVFGFLYQDNSFNTSDCHDEFVWTTAHGLSYPEFIDIEDVLFEYVDAYSDNGSVGFPWLLLFLPENTEHTEGYLAYNGHNIEEVNQILNDVWVPQLGIEENVSSEKKLVKIVDQLGRETSYKPNTALIYVYSDGSTKKVFTIE